MPIEITQDTFTTCTSCGKRESDQWWVADDLCEECRIKEQILVHKIEYQGYYWKIYIDEEPDVYHVVCYGPTIVWGCTYPDFLLMFDVLQAEHHDIASKLQKLDKANRGSKKFLTRVLLELNVLLRNEPKTSKNRTN